MKTITIFGSSLPGEGSAAYEDARLLGRLLAERGYLVCNGGYGGLMAASARGARESGGHTIGVTCALWPAVANPWIVEEVRAATFLDRLINLIERGDAYVVLPGGTGTLAELALVWEMMNKSALAQTVGGRKPLLVVTPYWQPVIDCLSQESRLNARGGAQRAPAMEMVTLIERPEDVVKNLGLLPVS
ncbi:MAG: LOG family protein [Acidobacteria bacterium]|nr:LOG family protein [Acidobacteriota bacterium]